MGEAARGGEGGAGGADGGRGGVGQVEAGDVVGLVAHATGLDEAEHGGDADEGQAEDDQAAESLSELTLEHAGLRDGWVWVIVSSRLPGGEGAGVENGFVS